MPADDTVAAEPIEARFPFTGPLDLRLTMAPLGHGRPDFTGNFGVDGVWRALALRLSRLLDAAPACGGGCGEGW
jgi:hypothetical protein